MTEAKTYRNMNSLSLSWSVSRGRDTAGYNICRLDSRATDKRYRTCGGGYDMIGTVFGDWLEAEHQGKLRELVAKHADSLKDAGYAVQGYKKLEGFYGLTVRPDSSVQLDGACGINSMERIAEALGLELQGTYNKKGHRTGWIVAEIA